MPADYSALEASVQGSLAIATENETVVDSAITLIEGHGQAIIDAVVADNAIDQENTDRLTAIVNQVTAAYTAQKTKLAAAIAANTPSA